MTDMDRFAAFLVREAAGYNRPPATPADAMWPGVEGRLGAIGAGPGVRVGDADTGLGAEAAGGAGSSGGRMHEGLTYNASPPVPREEMWTRIEAAWALRRSVVGKGAGPVGRAGRRWLARPGGKGWVAALAAAASLVLGIALGRGTRPELPVEAGTPQASPETAGVTAPAESPATVAETDTGRAAGHGRREGVRAGGRPRRADHGDRSRRACGSGCGRSSGGRRGDTAYAGIHFTAGTGRAPAAAGLTRARRRRSSCNGPGLERALPSAQAGLHLEPEFDYVTARHLGRAATLLTAFRTDRRTPASQADLARWARELLAETRMFLGFSTDSGSHLEYKLLEDLELVLIQIAGLAPGAPDFEWELARESMERRGTLVRLQAASTAGET